MFLHFNATAKSIAGGVPLAAVIARNEVFDAVPSGVIGGTFGGNALACAAGLKVLEVIDDEKLVERANEIGRKITERFNQWKEKYECKRILGNIACCREIKRYTTALHNNKAQNRKRSRA